MSDTEIEYFQGVLDRFEIVDWDLILIGDGSGSKWGLPVGWAVTAIAKTKMEREVFYGAMNNATVNIAETMAYLQPLLWYLRRVADERKKGGTTREHVVHIITDSEYVKNVGKRGHLDFSTNQPLWGVFEFVKRQSIQINWYWAKRDDVALNTYADALSKKARKLMKENDPAAAMARAGYSAEDFNPWE
jgi:ribonuclease HI